MIRLSSHVQISPYFTCVELAAEVPVAYPTDRCGPTYPVSGYRSRR